MPASSWKQEVSLRIAAHQSRRCSSTAKPPAPVHSRAAASSRAAQAAARVAARYAQAPSYSQMQAAEAHAALRTAEIATQAALEANAAAQAALAGLHSAAAAPRLWTPEAMPAEAFAPLAMREPSATPPRPAAPPSLPASLQAWESEYSHIRWEPDLRLRPLEPLSDPVSSSAAARAPRPESFAPPVVDGWEQPALLSPLANEWEGEAIEPVEPDLPIHANLIEFPRELVATRKMRPRRVEGPLAAEGLERQLSIFEVDPGTLAVPAAADDAAPAPDPQWSSIKLEAQPVNEPEPPDPAATLAAVQLAPIGRRLMAALVDGALITCAFLASAVVAAAHITHPPAARIVGLCAVSAFLLFAALYYALFLTLGESTPGMKCAGVSLCTFDGQIPTRAQLRSRLGALLLSMVPVGLGVAWALFDDDHLSWHDRLSRTYLRQN
jgi:uncharacterized RDD family membrane protein YckC